MSRFNLNAIAGSLPEAWRSLIVSEVGTARIKVLRMDASCHQEETHDYNEALVVVDGTMKISLGQKHWTVNIGEIFMVTAHTPHAVLPGSSGTLLIIDTSPQR